MHIFLVIGVLFVIALVVVLPLGRSENGYKTKQNPIRPDPDNVFNEKYSNESTNETKLKKQNNNPKIVLSRESNDNFILNISCGNFDIENKKGNNEVYYLFNAQGYETTSVVGKPQLPVIRRMIAMPIGAKSVSVKVLGYNYSIIGKYKIYPFQQSQILGNTSNFTIDRKFYSKDIFYPEEIANIQIIGSIRDFRFAMLQVNPIRFNPNSTESMFSKNISLKIEFTFDKNNNNEFKSISPAFESFYESIFLNYNYIKEDNRQNLKGRDSVDDGKNVYLIITNDTFYDSILPLAEWREARGFEVMITNLSEIDNGSEVNDTELRTYIYDVFHNFTVYNLSDEPSFLLLVGDANEDSDVYLPTHYGKRDPRYQRKLATDLYFSAVNNSSYNYTNLIFPDIFLGRLPVNNISETEIIVNKIINYEKDPFIYLNENDWWFDKALLVTNDVDQGISSEVDEAFKEIFAILTREKYNISKVNSSEPGLGTSNISNYVNAGQAIVNYIGHGSDDYWTDPYFNNSNVLSLENSHKLPIVTSTGCWNGRFVNSTNDCIGEKWLKAENKGGVASFGGSVPVWVQEGCKLDAGIFKAIFNDGLRYFSQIADRSKLYSIIHWNGTDMYKTQQMYEMFNVLGDPALKVWIPPSEPIRIDSDDNFTDLDYSIGSGTKDDPYVIQNLKINGTGYNYGMFIGNVSNSHFRIENCFVENVTGPRYWPGYNPSSPGIELYKSSNGTVSYNKCFNNDYGIWLYNASNNIVTNNNCSNNIDEGISISYLNNVTLSNNNCSQTINGIVLFNSSITVSNNTCYSNSNSGIILSYQTHNNTIFNNICSNITDTEFGMGILMHESSNNSITYNNLKNNNYGIHIWDENECDESSNNIINHNMFINNTIQAYDPYGTNNWNNDYPSGGNYWSNWIEPDNNKNGFVDEPKVISGGAGTQDNYPLTTVPHFPIRINSDADFDTQFPGRVISNLRIDGTGYGYCIYIGNVTEDFILENCYLHNASDVDQSPYYYDSGLILYRTPNGYISNVTSFNNNQHGIYLRDIQDPPYTSKNTLINNNCSNNNGDGIHLQSASCNNITNNLISSNNAKGIYISEGSIFGNTMTNNKLHSNSYGIYISANCNDNEIYHNNFIDNTYNAYDYASNSWDINIDGNLEGNYWSDYPGGQPMQNYGTWDTEYEISGGINRDNYPLINPFDSVWNINQSTYHITIGYAISKANPGETIELSYGIYYENVVIEKSLIISGKWSISTIIDGGGFGDVIEINADEVTIREVTVNNSGSGSVGILINSIKNIITQNRCTNNDIGIFLSDSKMNTISYNYCLYNDYGICLYQSGDVEENKTILSNNICNFNSEYGIYVDQSSYNSFQNNNCSNNSIGVYLIDSDSTNLTYNILYDNIGYGVQVYSSNNCIIHHNDFIINNGANEAYNPLHIQACDDNPSGFNTWYEAAEEEGNHWSDWIEPDENEDGIVDLWYELAGFPGNFDNYPLVIPVFAPI